MDLQWTYRNRAMKNKLNQSTIKGLEPADKPYEVYDTETNGFILRVQPSGAMTYYLSYRNHERKRLRYRIGSTKELSPTQARDLAKALVGKVAAGEDIQTAKKHVVKKAEDNRFKTLTGFIEGKYKDWVINNRKSGYYTIETIERNFSQLNSRLLNDINPWVIEKWRTERLKAGIARSTINRDLAALKSALSKAVEWGIIENHPLAKLKPLKIDHKLKVRFLSKSEELRLREALIERDRGIVKLRDNGNKWREQRNYHQLPQLTLDSYGDHLTVMTLLSLNTGLRRGEMFKLSWSDVQLKSKTLTIGGENAKSGLTRHIPLNRESLEVLSKWKAQTFSTGLVFPSKDGKPFTTIKRSWGSLLEAANITGFRWHDLRHDFASKLVMAGVPLNTVRELLGHRDLTTTLRYAHLAPDHKAEAVEKLTKLHL